MTSARAGAGYLRDMISEEADTDSDRDRLRAAGIIAGDAFDEYAGFLADLAERGSKATGNTARSVTAGS